MRKPKKEVAMLAKQIRTALNLLEGGADKKVVASVTGLTKPTVERWESVAKNAGIDALKAREMGDEELKDLFRNKRGPKASSHFPIDITATISRLEDHMTVLETYQIYRTESEEALRSGLTTAKPLCKSSYFSQVSEQLKLLRGERQSTMQIWPAGQYLLIDLAGDVIVLTDEFGNKVVCYVYVAIVPATNLIYARVMPNRTTAEWILSIVATFTFLDCLPRHITCDNDTALVANATRGCVKLTDELQKLVGFYEGRFDIESCRVRAPRDKAAVEWAVKRITNCFIRKFKPGSLHTIEDAQMSLDAVVAGLNHAVSPTTGISPMRDFMDRERHAMQELPDFTYHPLGKVHRYTITKPGRYVQIEGHSYLSDYKYTYGQIDACVGEDGQLHFLSIADGVELWTYPHYEYGKPDPITGFKHAKDEFRAPHELTREKYLAVQKEEFAKLGAGAVKFMNRFMAINRYMGKWKMGDQLKLLRDKLSGYPNGLLNDALEHACDIGAPTVSTVIAYVRVFADGVNSRRRREAVSNLGACLHDEAEMMGALKVANSSPDGSALNKMENR